MANDYICREAEIRFFNDWVDDLDKQINDSVNCPHLRSDYKVCKTQLLDCIHAIKEMPAADVVPVEWVPVKERLPEPCFPVWAACKAADGRENWVIETSYIPNPQSKSQWGPVPILETGRATVYAWAERHPPEAPKEG